MKKKTIDIAAASSHDVYCNEDDVSVIAKGVSEMKRLTVLFGNRSYEELFVLNFLLFHP